MHAGERSTVCCPSGLPYLGGRAPAEGSSPSAALGSDLDLSGAAESDSVPIPSIDYYKARGTARRRIPLNRAAVILMAAFCPLFSKVVSAPVEGTVWVRVRMIGVYVVYFL